MQTQLREELAACRAKCATLEQENKILKKDIKSLTCVNEDLQEELESCEEQCQCLETQLRKRKLERV